LLFHSYNIAPMQKVARRNELNLAPKRTDVSSGAI
jgi:hypothetical protein